MIGTVLKPQGVRGECKIKPYAADLNRFASWKELYLESGGTYIPVPCHVSRIHEGFVYAVLDNCKSADDAEKLRGRELYIDRTHAAPPEEGAFFIADLIGCQAEDETGRVVGTLTDVLQHGPVDTWVFSTPRGTMMAPALLTVFPEVDPQRRRISVLSEKLMEVAVFDR
jgi:16S rRNA processing protein RimM